MFCCVRACIPVNIGFHIATATEAGTVDVKMWFLCSNDFSSKTRVKSICLPLGGCSRYGLGIFWDCTYDACVYAYLLMIPLTPPGCCSFQRGFTKLYLPREKDPQRRIPWLKDSISNVFQESFTRWELCPPRQDVSTNRYHNELPSIAGLQSFTSW